MLLRCGCSEILSTGLNQFPPVAGTGYAMTPYLARIDIFPIKSMDGVSVPQAMVLASGALACDRAYALLDAQNRFINAKRTAAIQRLRTKFSKDMSSVTCRKEGESEAVTFHLKDQQQELEAWLSDFFEQPVTLASNPSAGFPDDTEAAGPTVISTATLETVASWYPDISVEEVRRRFRTNLELGGVPAFWEDQLFSPEGKPVKFTIGDVVLEGVNPCQRCIVPTRSVETGQATPNFQKVFLQKRAVTLPEWTHPGRFNHFYRLAINTNVNNQPNKTLTIGSPVELLP
jgi:hypothetical protein